MASIFKRQGKGNYIIMYFDDAGRRRERSSRTTDKRAAERIAARIEADVALRREGLVDDRKESISRAAKVGIAEHVEDYLTWCESSEQAPRSIFQKASHLRKVIGETRVRRLVDLTADVVDGNLRGFHKAGKSARTVNYRRQIVVAFMNWAVRRGRIAGHTLAEVPKRDERADRRRMRRALTEDELQRLFVVAEERGRLAWYMAAAYAGLRKGDLRALRWEDLDFKRQSITITDGKAKRTDVIPLAPALADALSQHRPEGRSPGDRVFPTAVTDRTRQKDFACAGIPGVDERGRVADLHCLRMTLGSMLAKNGVPPQVCQAILRHADYRTTLRHYTDLQLEDSAEALSGILRNLP